MMEVRIKPQNNLIYYCDISWNLYVPLFCVRINLMPFMFSVVVGLGATSHAQFDNSSEQKECIEDD